MKIDLHVHSKFSTRPSQWILQKLGCPESFVEPKRIYELARAKGMTHVTISDHNTIEGALEIAHLPGTFISEEITSYFPEDGCKVHVLAWNISEAQHEEITRLRENVRELAPFLRQEKIPHAAAHPLFGVNDRLTTDHFEQLLLLFDTFEINGTRDETQNRTLRRILHDLDLETVERLALKHGIAPAQESPWIKRLCGGSDDHGGMNIARIHTEVPGASDISEFFHRLKRGEGQVHGDSSTPRTMAHNLYAIGYQFYRERCDLGRLVNRDPFLKFLDCSLSPGSPQPGLFGKSVMRYRELSRRFGRKPDAQTEPEELRPLLRRYAEEEFYGDEVFRECARAGVSGAETADGINNAGFRGTPEDDFYEFAERVANRTLAHYADNLLHKLDNANIFGLLPTIASAGTLYSLLTPYFVSYTLFTKDRAFCRKVMKRFGHEAETLAERPVRLAHFTDTFAETNGVAKTLQEHLKMAHAANRDYRVITCTPEKAGDYPGLTNFTPIGSYNIPEYPELSMNYPSPLAMLDYVFREGITHIHSATPGPVGLAALCIARILKLPISGTYHTAFPQYALHLTGDTDMEAMMWKAMIWYYGQMDTVYVPSRAVGRELVEHGIEEARIKVYPRGVDTERFTPAKRNGFFRKYDADDGIKLIYVGRISREKEMPLLEKAFLKVAEQRPDMRLVIVGDGPYRQQMERNLAGTNTLFTGVLEGEDLAAAYASSDLFVFPSTTDTFGRVVLEAQASGIPVIVSDKGGPQENLEAGITGEIVSSGSADAFAKAILNITDTPDRLRKMGAAARRSLDRRSLENAFDDTWNLYASETGEPPLRTALSLS